MEDKYRGVVFGVAVCDAVGAIVEFQKRGSFAEVTGLGRGGKFDLLEGEWTDDTSMSLCVAASIILNEGRFEPHDQMRRLMDWYETGHMSSTGECFDIGKCTLRSLGKWRRATKDGTSVDGVEGYHGPCTEEANGNGTLMRLAPVPLAYRHDAAVRTQCAAQLDRTTHGGEHSASACRAYAAMVSAALEETATTGEAKARVLQAYGAEDALCPEVHAVLVGRSYQTKGRDDVSAGGWVVPALEAALWAFASTETFDDGCLACANLGDDADTAGAVYGQLAGAFYGFSAINPAWTGGVALPTLLTAVADGLLAVAEGHGAGREAFAAVHAAVVKLEADTQRMVRRGRPGPRMYRAVADLQADAADAARRHRADPEVGAALLADYERLWQRLERKVEARG